MAFPVSVKLQFPVQNLLPIGFKLQKLPNLICVFSSNRMDEDKSYSLHLVLYLHVYPDEIVALDDDGLVLSRNCMG